MTVSPGWLFAVLLLTIAGCAQADVTSIPAANHMIAQVMNMLKHADPASRGKVPSDALDEPMPRTATFDYNGDSLQEQIAPVISSAVGATSKGIDPLKMITEIGNSCVDVPSLIQQTWAAPHCSATAEEVLKMIKSMATVYIDFVLSRRVQNELLPPETQELWERLAKRQCEDPACQSLMRKVFTHGISCEVATICALESAILPVNKCQSILNDFFAKALSLQTICDTEPMTGEFSSIVVLRLMSENPMCYLELNKINQGCSQDCRHWWMKQRRRYPHSTMTLATQITEMQSLGQKFASQLEGFPKTRIMMRSPDEICADLGIAASFQV